MAKRRKPTTCDKFWRSATSIDMFGERIRFNMDGKETFDTCCGSICTLLIFGVVALYTIFQLRLYNN